MLEKEVGFVLKRFLPSTHKISLLTQEHGKLNIIVKRTDALQRVWPGMLIGCQPKPLFEATYTSDSIEIIDIPPTLTSDDTFLVHHLLDLCYYFVPLASPCPEIFDHLNFCFNILLQKHLFEKNFDAIKRVLVLRFLYLAEVLPMQSGCETTMIFARLTPYSLDIEDQQKVESISLLINEINKIGLRTVDKLIFDCIKTHPSFKLLKTVPFLYEAKSM